MDFTENSLIRLYDDCVREHTRLLNDLRIQNPNSDPEGGEKKKNQFIYKNINLLNQLMTTLMKLRDLKKKMAMSDSI